MDFNAIPTLGSVRERLGYFATITEEGELNTTLNNAYNCIYELETEIKRLREWKELAYEMRNRSWWAMRNKVLVKFDDMHKSDWESHE